MTKINAHICASLGTLAFVGWLSTPFFKPQLFFAIPLVLSIIAILSLIYGAIYSSLDR